MSNRTFLDNDSGELIQFGPLPCSLVITDAGHLAAPDEVGVSSILIEESDADSLMVSALNDAVFSVNGIGVENMLVFPGDTLVCQGVDLTYMGVSSETVKSIEPLTKAAQPPLEPMDTTPSTAPAETDWNSLESDNEPPDEQSIGLSVNLSQRYLMFGSAVALICLIIVYAAFIHPSIPTLEIDYVEPTETGVDVQTTEQRSLQWRERVKAAWLASELATVRSYLRALRIERGRYQRETLSYGNDVAMLLGVRARVFDSSRYVSCEALTADVERFRAAELEYFGARDEKTNAEMREVVTNCRIEAMAEAEPEPPASEARATYDDYDESLVDKRAASSRVAKSGALSPLLSAKQGTRSFVVSTDSEIDQALERYRAAVVASYSASDFSALRVLLSQSKAGDGYALLRDRAEALLARRQGVLDAIDLGDLGRAIAALKALQNEEYLFGIGQPSGSILALASRAAALDASAANNVADAEQAVDAEDLAARFAQAESVDDVYALFRYAYRLEGAHREAALPVWKQVIEQADADSALKRAAQWRIQSYEN